MAETFYALAFDINRLTKVAEPNWYIDWESAKKTIEELREYDQEWGVGSFSRRKIVKLEVEVSDVEEIVDADGWADEEEPAEQNESMLF